MKVAKLINALRLLDPNSDIFIYNGYVGDWQDILIEAGELVKMKPHVRKEYIVISRFQEGGLPFPTKETLKEESKKIKVEKGTWEFNYYADNPDIYDFKVVNLLCGKTRNKVSCDRAGSLEY